jgi:hypothetical protein
MSSRSARRSFAALVLSALGSAVLTGLAPAAAFAVTPTAPVKLPSTIEIMPPYQPQTFCSPTVKPGTQALANKLTATYAGTAIVSLVRPCGTDTSEHYDGRAIDWGVDHRNDKQRSQGKAFLSWLFASDKAGNDHAMVRRLGVMYVIWNKQIWGSWSQKWEPYSCSGVTACHVDHMHISLDWSGAMKKTSFWTGIVRAPMPPPLVSIRALHDAKTQQVSVRDDAPTPVYRLVAGARYRITVAGHYRYDDRTRHHADAGCSTSDGTTWVARQPGEPTPGQYDLFVNGSHYWRATGTVVNGCSTTHTYRRYVTTADKGVALRLAINDPSRWLGSGSLTVTVVRVA